jgi:hypothetical protein
VHQQGAQWGRRSGALARPSRVSHENHPRESRSAVIGDCGCRWTVAAPAARHNLEAEPRLSVNVSNVLNVPSRQPSIHGLRDKKKRRYFLIFPPCLRIRLRARSRAARKQRGIHDCRGALVERVAKMLAHHPGEKAPAGRGRVTAPNAWRHRLHLHFPKARHGDCRSALQLPATPFSHFWAKHPIHGSWIPRVQISLSLALQRQSATPFLLSFTMAR